MWSRSPPDLQLLFCSSSLLCYFVCKLDVFTAVSGTQLLTMANQVLTINVTEQVRCDSCHGLLFAKQKSQRSPGVPPQGQIWVSGVPVVEAAVEAKNGRVYVLDGVLTPPSILPLLPHRCDVTDSKIIQVRFPLFC